MLKVLQIFNANATMIPQHQHNTDNCIMLSRLFYCQQPYNISWYPERRWS